MDDLLPSYQSVVEQDPWHLIAPYLPSTELCAAALVCQKWHRLFTPELWGNPASHFGVENDTLYVALTRFKRTLTWARLLVRELCHTLHLPPAHAEIYGGPHAEWLRDCLERLPRLQSLIVQGLPFFDHASLLTLRHSSMWWKSSHPESYPVFSLRLLDASYCANVTSASLAEALPHLPDLVSLDLSRTSASREIAVFRTLKQLRSLRALSMRYVGLKDEDLKHIATSIGQRVRSLDVSDNQLTDVSAEILAQYCFGMNNAEIQSTRARSPLPPVEHGEPLAEMDIFGTQDLAGHLRRKLTSGFIGGLAVESSWDTGITHLYVSNNAFSPVGISRLLKTKKLRVIDVGTLPPRLSSPKDSPSLEPRRLPAQHEELTKVLACCSHDSMVFLRVNHGVVTKDAPVDESLHTCVEAEGDLPSTAPSSAQELDATASARSELDCVTTAVHELAGDSLLATELPTEISSGSKPTSLTREQGPYVRDKDQSKQPPAFRVTVETSAMNRGPEHAPEPLRIERFPLSPTGLHSLVAEDRCSIASASSSRAGAQISLIDEFANDALCQAEERHVRLKLRQSQENRLHPGMLSKTRTLVLTDVPLQSQDEEVVSRLVQFVKDCAEEAAIARLYSQQTYMLPPGRSRTLAEKEYATSLFALERLVLEMAPVSVAREKIASSWRQYPTKSSTEDGDSEAFWEAATHDFSFFGEEECGLPTTEISPPLAAMDGLMLAAETPSPQPPARDQPELTERRMINTIAEMAKFRQERKAAYQAAVEAQGGDPIVEGHWNGSITIVTHPADTEDGSMDFYGNRYQSGWLYR